MNSSRTRNAIIPIIMIAAGIVFLLGSFYWFVSAQGDEAVVSSSEQTMRIPHPEIARISVQDAKAAFDTGTAIFIDTRGEPYFSQGHIPGALAITEDEIINYLDELRSADWIITYCTWPAEDSSAGAVRILMDNNFNHAMPIKGGLEAWIKAGYPIER